MTLLQPPAYMTNGLLPASNDRINLGSWLAPDGATALGARGGVLIQGVNWPFRIKQLGGGAMAVVVPAGSFVVPASVGGGGAYEVHNDADYSVNVGASGGTTRHDKLILEVVDEDYNNGADHIGRFRIIPGAPALPATPGNAIALADITVTAGATQILDASIASLHTYTTTRGGPVPLRSTDSDPANPFPGMKTFNVDTAVEKLWTGSAWTQTYPRTSHPSLHVTTIDGAAGQSIGSTFTVVNFTSVIEDTHSGWNAALNYYVVPSGYSGKWVCTGGITYAANATGSRAVRLARDVGVGFTAVVGRTELPMASSNSGVEIPIPRALTLLAGDKIQLQAVSPTGAISSVNSGEARPYLDLQWMGP